MVSNSSFAWILGHFYFANVFVVRINLTLFYIWRHLVSSTVLYKILASSMLMFTSDITQSQLIFFFLILKRISTTWKYDLQIFEKSSWYLFDIFVIEFLVETLCVNLRYNKCECIKQISYNCLPPYLILSSWSVSTLSSGFDKSPSWNKREIYLSLLVHLRDKLIVL